MNTNVPDDEMADEYDFSDGERGRLAKRLEGGYDIVIDGKEDQPIHVKAEDVRAGQAAIDARRKPLPRRALAEDTDDLAAFGDRAGEPTLPFDELVADLKRRGRL